MFPPPPARSQYSVLIRVGVRVRARVRIKVRVRVSVRVEVTVRLGLGLGEELRLALGLVKALFGRLVSLLVGGTSFHCTMNAIGNFPPDLWWLICLFLPPINTMQLLRIPYFFDRMRLGRPIFQTFMNFLMERLAKYMPYPSMLMGLLYEHNPMGDPRAIISGSTVLEGIQHERFFIVGLDIYCHWSIFSLLYQHLVDKQLMELICMRSKEILEQCAHLEKLNSIGNFCAPGLLPRFVQVIVVDCPQESLRNIVLGFDINVVQNYFDGHGLFCAASRSVLKKIACVCAGRYLDGQRIEKYIRRGYVFLHQRYQDNAECHLFIEDL